MNKTQDGDESQFGMKTQDCERTQFSKEALFYKSEDDYIRCLLCPHVCKINAGERGVCNVRYNNNGTLEAENYGMVTSIAMDPLEKKPLYHFYPGRYILSIGSYGCNLKCSYCQNWEISQVKAEGRYVEPDEMIKIALNQKDNIGIAYTYNEPTVNYEYVYDCAKMAKEHNLKNVLVTNGYINEKPLYKLIDSIDAMNIDIKAYTDEFYNEICAGRLKDVLKTVSDSYEKCHVEITTLIIPDLNDNESDIENLTRWIAGLNEDIPLHLTRYFPNYKMRKPPTDIEKLYQLRDIAKHNLNYVYIGNVFGADMDTYCPQCGNTLVERDLNVRITGLDEDGNCARCGKKINIKR